MTVREKINAFVVLLSNPNPDSPLNQQAANMFNKTSKSEYFQKALKQFRRM